jgi:hypothetical protein
MPNGMWARRIVVAGLLILATTAALPGCASLRNGPTPLLICGGNLAGGVATPVVTDVLSGDQTIMRWSVDDAIFLRLTDSCDQGVSLDFDPRQAATVARSVAAKDGKPVAIEIQAHQRDFAIRLARGDGSRSTVTMKLSAARTN